MPARITPVTERTALGQAEHAETMTASPSAPPAKKQVKRQAKLTVDGPSAAKKRRISKTTKEKPSPSTRKQSIKKDRGAATTVLAPEAPDPLVGIVSCVGQPTTAESGNPDSLPVVGDYAAATAMVPVSAGPSNLEVPMHRPGKPKKVVDPGVLRSAGTSRRKPTKRSAKYADNNACQVQWKVVTPPKSSEDKDRGLHNATVEYSDNNPELRPRVWASCREDLVHVIPELSKPTNGLSWKSLESPIMLLEDQVSVTWSAESQNMMTLELSMTQEYLYPAKPLPASPRHLRVDPVLEPEDEPMTLIQDNNEDQDDLSEALATAEEITQSQEVSDEELPLLQHPDHSPKAQTPEISLSKAEDTPLGITMLVKNSMPSTIPTSFPSEPSSQMIANGEPADNQQQAPAPPPQVMETSVNSPKQDIPTPVGAMTESYMSELPPAPSPDPKSQSQLVDLSPTFPGNVIETLDQEEFIPQETPVKGRSTTRFNWRFRLKWSPGDDSGTTTYDYSSVLSVPILIKHIFTHNRSSLQQDATHYAHFSYVVGADFLGMGVKKLYWSEASGTVTSEAERLSRLAEQRGDFRVSRFSPDVTVIAWPSAGTTKQTQVLKARENAICVQCLGSSALISLCALPTPETSASIKEIDSTTRSKERKEQTRRYDRLSGSSVVRSPPEEKEKQMSVSLVHGDILVIWGHDVELKVKRNHATTICSTEGQTAFGDIDDDIGEDVSIRVEDEDWENAERDFTKQYNRLRQHVAVRAGVAQSSQSSIDHSSKVAVLPAVNHPQSRKLAVSNATALSHSPDKTADQLEALSKYASRISKIDTPYSQHMGVGVNRKGPSSYANMKDKADRATTEQVLDPRTRIILFKMIGRGILQEINGCISTGKEANVYHALSPEAVHLAVKIFKTSILVFKDRDRYVAGEFRFRRGYNRHNPRKMVRLWAEKEMRNLKRLSMAGIRCPEPVEVRENVLVMRFLGDSEGWPSPRLKDAQLPEGALPGLYQELVLTTRQLYHQCKLVHADLSEYNILYHDSHLFIIDVSQSVEHDHPSAFDFLRSDITNIEEFFGRLGVTCLGLRRTFDFVTRDRLSPDSDGEPVSDAEILTNWLRNPEPREDGSPHDGVGEGGDGDMRQASLSKHEDSVFLHSYIPRSLNDVLDPERDIAAVSRGEAKQLIYANTLGIVNENVADVVPGGHDSSVSQDDSSEPEDEDSDEGDSDAPIVGDQRRKPRGHRFEDKEAKKERKKTTKAEAREKRKNKTPKAEKKRLIKKTARA
ncbi:protein kinase rio1 [Pleurotus ostreatus]|uniref:Serine/threonine-protein kinase RIO1 n=1 Tax=Pleurotus ostreatus TaxID=5322 RepID=A0A8H6ZS37_PLEOS|nr:protein kinase rio1 [Pleurotus ostreatus]KAF7422527.1 protein kinase rio1 [Pleurotus ostreatus]